MNSLYFNHFIPTLTIYIEISLVLCNKNMPNMITYRKHGVDMIGNTVGFQVLYNIASFFSSYKSHM